MLLKCIKLHNIRSYINEEITFPNGSLLLSGDVGSGKSSILLAIEFALFGILRGDLSGGALLRNGAKEGFVELKFEIEGNEIVIRRNLKRGSSSIEQDAGCIRHNGTARVATAQELKTAVLDLLGYPKDLLTKSKSLIYRYTVYTPQEDMKRIIFEDKETRLNILRKVFDIDKYKRIQENAATYMGILRGRIRECEGMISDLEAKKKAMQEKLNEVGQLEAELSKVGRNLNDIKAVVERNKADMKQLEQEAKRLEEFRKELRVCETEVRYKAERIAFNEYEIERFGRQINELDKGLAGKKEIDLNELAREMKAKNELVHNAERDILRLKGMVSEFNANKKHSESLKSKILTLSTCPVCLQEVAQVHKQAFAVKEDEKLKEIEAHIAMHNQKILQEEASLNTLKQALELIREQEKMGEAVKVKLVTMKEKQQSKNDLILLQEKLKRELLEFDDKKKGLSSSIESLAYIEQHHIRAKKELDSSLEIEKEVLVVYNRLRQKSESLLELLKALGKEIEAKELTKQKLGYLQRLHSWMDIFFVNIVNVMEKRFMARVYSEFNELFCKWSSILVESEVLQAKLDESFTPVIQQNGYDTELENLSGGEKTACALAYRLALNKVINSLMTSIKTKDILILDEPTDGFSEEQLDKIRDVLEQLQARQVLIVSHESKIESFVDNVLRVHKEEHVSRVIG